MSLITDETLMRLDIPTEELRRRLLAKTIIRMAWLKTGKRFTRVDDALAALEVARCNRVQATN